MCIMCACARACVRRACGVRAACVCGTRIGATTYQYMVEGNVYLFWFCRVAKKYIYLEIGMFILVALFTTWFIFSSNVGFESKVIVFPK